MFTTVVDVNIVVYIFAAGYSPAMSKENPTRSNSLPRGPHALSREEVAQSQRERLLAAMIECVAERGYAQTSVAEVLTHSGVSRATFYQLFADKEDCFRAAYGQAAAQLTAALAASLPPEAQPAEPLQRLGRMLEVYLGTLAQQPAVARTFLVEVHAAGLAMNEQRQTAIEAFIDLVAGALQGRLAHLGTAAEQRFAVKLLVHGLISLVTGMISAGETARLPELRKPLLKLAAKLVE